MPTPFCCCYCRRRRHRLSASQRQCQTTGNDNSKRNGPRTTNSNGRKDKEFHFLRVLRVQFEILIFVYGESAPTPAMAAEAAAPTMMTTMEIYAENKWKQRQKICYGEVTGDRQWGDGNVLSFFVCIIIIVARTRHISQFIYAFFFIYRKILAHDINAMVLAMDGVNSFRRGTNRREQFLSFFLLLSFSFSRFPTIIFVLDLNKMIIILARNENSVLFEWSVGGIVVLETFENIIAKWERDDNNMDGTPVAAGLVLAAK